MRNPVTIGGPRNPVTIRGPRNPVTIRGPKNPVTILGPRNPVTIVNVQETGGGGSTLVVMDFIANFSSGTGLITAEMFNAGVHGASWGQNWTDFHNGASEPNTDTYIEEHNVQLPFDVEVDGVIYDGTEGQGLLFDFSAAPTSYDAYQLGLSGFQDVVTMYIVQSNVVLSTDNYFNDILAHLAGNYTIGQMQARFGDDSRVISSHSEGSLGREVPFTTGDWLLVSVFHNGSAGTAGFGNVLVHKLEVEVDGTTSLGDVLGHSVSNYSNALPGNLVNITLQTYLRLADAPSTGNIKVKLIACDRTTLRYPPYTIPVVPAPSSILAFQLGLPSVTVTWTSNNCQIFDIQRNKNSGGFVALHTAYDTEGTDSIVDADVTNGDVVQYRFRTVIGDQTSDWAESNSHTVSDFTPAAGNVLWLKADSLALANNDPVTTWSDSSGSGNHVTQSSASLKPTYKTNIINGLPVVRGDGGDHLAHTGVVTSSQQHTMMIVLKANTNSTVPFYNGNSSANGWGFFQGGSGTRNVLFGGAVDKTDGSVSLTDFEIWEHVWNGSVSSFFVNGVSEDLTDPGTAPGGDPTGDTLVMGLPGGNQWVGDVAEIIVWDNAVSLANRQAARNYLSNKYAITLP